MKIAIYVIIILFVSCNSENNSMEDVSNDIENQLDEVTSINLGEIETKIFEKNDKFNFLLDGEQSRSIKFSLQKYSKLNFNISGFDGSLSLFSITENRFMTHNGGVLGGGSVNLDFFLNRNYEFELFEGEYEISIKVNSSSFKEDELITGEYLLKIEDINDLIPYLNLGELELYNETFIADNQRLSNTLYEFEILENSNITVFVDGNSCLNLPDLEIQTYLYNLEGERIGDDFISNIFLNKGIYKLFFNGKRTLILNDPDRGDRDFGRVANFPRRLDIDLDMTYEPDGKKKVHFEILEKALINEEFTTYIIENFNKSLFNSQQERINITTPLILKPGKYSINFTTEQTAYGLCNEIYRIIKQEENLILSKN